MIKQGLTPLPPDKVPAFAKSLGVDPVHLLRLSMNEYQPNTWQVIEETLSKQLVSSNERALIEIVREIGEGSDIFPDSDADVEEFKELVRKWKARSDALSDASARRAARDS